MYLTGEQCLMDRTRTNRELIGERYQLGYWRKHPNLHGWPKHVANGLYMLMHRSLIALSNYATIVVVWAK